MKSLGTIRIVYLFIASFFLIQCREKEVPLLSTKDIIEITHSGAKTGGEIISDRDEAITVKGVCWSTDPDPTLDDNSSKDGSGPESFTSHLENLAQGTTYYVRSYASNLNGTGYGDVKSFKTSDILSDIDGNSYSIVYIGNQAWMKENLRTTRFRDGTAIPLITQNSEWQTKTSGAHSNYANNNANVIVYGSLYNWYAVHDIKGLCPTGWHVPTNEEWTTLINTLGGLEVAGGKLKESGLDHWTFPNAGADNSSDFGAIGAGFRDMNGTYTGLNQNVYFWSSSEYSLTHGISRKLYFDYPYVSFAGNYKQSGFSVRCIKD